MKKIKTGLVGFGSVGEKIHAPLIHHSENLELTAVVERSSSKSKERYPHVQVYRSLDAMLDAGEISLAVIVTPNEHHFEQAKLCLTKGVHVVVDKPVTIHSHEAEELAELAKEKGLLLTVFQNRRWDGDFQTIQNLIATGTLGRIVHFESHFDRFRPQLADNWREQEVPGNGITYDLGTHLIDQAIVLFGRPNWVNAVILKQRDKAVADDFFDITLGYEQVNVSVTASVLSNVPMQRFLVLGDKGSYIKYGLDVQEKALKAGMPPEGESWGLEEPEAWGLLYLEQATQALETSRGDYRCFYTNVSAAIQSGEPLEVKMEEAILVLQIIEAAFQSHAEGKRIVIQA
jgi:scyllo-inositol 2-dehydrogenase (NADP+)